MTVLSTNRAMGVANSTRAAKIINFNYTVALVTQKVFTAPYPMIVTGIVGVPRVAGSGGACTVQFWKAASGVAVASGTLLHSGTYDLVGTADINQDLTLVGSQTARTLAAGDSIGYVLTGTATSAVGAFTITLEPVA